MTKPGHKIIPHLWYNTEANEAAAFYCSIFPDSKITNRSTLHDTPSGNCDMVSFELSGQAFMAISGGPLFKFNPSVSFTVHFDPSKDRHARNNLDAAWEQLSHGGTALMPLDNYPFSERYGWIQNKYGLTWQLILSNPGSEERPMIVPSLLFVGAVCGKAEEASSYYLSVFKTAKRGTIARYPSGMEPDKEGTILFTDFAIENQWFAAMDSAGKHRFAFNEAVSFMISCETQQEIDYYWGRLSAIPEAEQCGWLKDKYGLSWQVTPALMGQIMKNATREQLDRITQAFLPMKKLDIAKLQSVYEGA